MAKQGITVHCVAPGWMGAGDIPRWARVGCPEEVAAATALLGSPESSDITGEVLVVDGGNCLIENKAPQGGSPRAANGCQSRGGQVARGVTHPANVLFA